MNDIMAEKVRRMMDVPRICPTPISTRVMSPQEQKGIVRWTCMELAFQLMDHPNQDSDEIFERFWMRYMCYIHKAHSPRVRDTFQIVLETVENVQRELVKGEVKNEA